MEEKWPKKLFKKTTSLSKLLFNYIYSVFPNSKYIKHITKFNKN